MTGNPWLAALMALFLWWFSTGIILWRVRRADNGGPDDHLWSVLLGLFLLGLGVLGFHQTLDDASPTGVYIGFLSALAIWGWIELAFLSGVITGPNTRPCPEHAPEWERFIRAFGTIAYHEILLAVTTIVMLAMAWQHPNHFGALTFAVLFVARISAKLNLFFGVANINTEFLPSTLSHLPSHFRRRPMNGFFPVSVTALCFAAGCWMERLGAATTPGAEAGYALLAALTLLALLEHWFMVLPLTDQKLWRWMIDPPAHKAKGPPPAGLKETTNGL
jgi:putative photosynthetic complex assembly protein 2